VLVDFWATWCGPCLEELPNIQRNYAAFKDLGFEVVGVNLDQEIGTVKDFFSVQPLPWTTVVSREALDGKASEYWSELPMAAKFGVDAIPFIVLVGKDGKVDSLHVRGPKLQTRLTQLLGEPGEEGTASGKPEAAKATDPKATDQKASGGRQPADDSAPEKKIEDKEPAPKKADNEGKPADKSDCDEPPAGEVPPAEPNPYSAKSDLTNEQLFAYIEKMLDKPQTIQSRPGFAAALVAACDRLLAAEPAAKPAEFFLAADAKFATLHKQACSGDEAAEQQLAAFVAQMQADERPQIARQVAFFRQERKVLEAADLPAEKIAELLKELRAYYAVEPLSERHLRMASRTVALINKLEDGDLREQQFAEFGELFAHSSDKQLARYGKKLAKQPAAQESDFVGKPLELTGATAKGLVFDWNSYRGKVVLVDFWATWCGPCRKAMPQMKEVYEKHREQGLEVVGVSLDKDAAALAQYLEENRIAWENLAGDETQALAEKYGVRSIPTLMLVDRTGRVLGVSHSLATLLPLLQKELENQPAK
jgi:thiol-disulfide isomerase/thioredoxin